MKWLEVFAISHLEPQVRTFGEIYSMGMIEICTNNIHVGFYSKFFHFQFSAADRHLFCGNCKAVEVGFVDADS